MVRLVELALLVLQDLEVLRVVVRQPGHVEHAVGERAHRRVGQAVVLVVAPALRRGAHRRDLIARLVRVRVRSVRPPGRSVRRCT